MSLLSKLREKRAGKIAAATPAIFATQGRIDEQTVANVATVSVAKHSQHASDQWHSTTGKQLQAHEEQPLPSGTITAATETTAIPALEPPYKRLEGSPYQRLATLTVATSATVVETSCRNCDHETRFGNCKEPVAAKISSRFMLIAHPHSGKNCGVFKPKPPWFVTEAIVRLDNYLALGSISPDDGSIAKAAIINANNDEVLVAEWAQFLDQCAAASRDLPK
ncbi:MAG: hypothetical protein KGO85_09065 [Proteobacteria bacterium]|nr:hypothetical protein [Pseudomonadota bacterium]